MVYDPEVHRRRSVRLRGYDYTLAGAYFVTLCAYERECLFGDVVDGMMVLNGYGNAVRDEWMRTPRIRPEVELDEFVLMPNHFHAILFITDVGAHRRAPPGGCNPPLQKSVCRTGAHIGAPPGGCNPPLQKSVCRTGAHIGAPLRRQPGSIGSIVAGFKSAATKRINALRDNPGAPVWQRNYYEHVIRGERDLDAIRQYIACNPAKWELDDNHPTRL